MLGDQDNAVIRTLASVRPLMFELITEAGINYRPGCNEAP